MVFQGALSGLRKKEIDGYLAHIDDLRSQIERLSNKVQEKEKTLAKVRPSESARRSVTEDEDEDDEEPESMVQLFRKRFNR